MAGITPLPAMDDDQLLRYSRHILLPEIASTGRKSCSARTRC